MPKLAATLASILLIASSIGVNIARYPQVGRTIDPARAGAAETASALQAADETPRVEKAAAELLPAKLEAAATAARDTRQGTANGELAADRMVAVAPRPVQQQSSGDIAIVDVRPMVSVQEAQSANSESPASQHRVERLPNIDSGEQLSSDSGSINEELSYPATNTP